MDYQLDLPPNLRLSAADFVAAWNASPACRDLAKARFFRPVAAPLDPSIFDQTPLLSCTIPPERAAAILHAPIHMTLTACNIAALITVAQVNQSDGGHLLVVTLGQP